MSTPIASPLLRQVQGVGRGAADRRRTEVLENHDLPFGVAAGHGDDARPQLFRAVMGAQPAGEKAVAVSVVDDVVLGQAGGDKAAGHQLRPGVDIPFGVSHDGRAAGCSR